MDALEKIYFDEVREMITDNKLDLDLIKAHLKIEDDNVFDDEFDDNFNEDDSSIEDGKGLL